jgi:hypothetical protein
MSALTKTGSKQVQQDTPEKERQRASGVVVNLENGKIIGRFSGFAGQMGQVFEVRAGHRAWRSSELPQPIGAAATQCNVIEFC